MKNIFISGIIIILLAGVWYYMTNTQVEAPSDETTVEQEQTTPEGNPEDEMVVEQETQTQENTSQEEVTVETDISNTVSIGAGEAKSFTVSGTNFAFDISEIRVQEGDTVTINFESADGFHDWVVDEFEAATQQVRPGTPTSVTFVADKAGTYEYYCSVGSHRANGMVGSLIVE